MKKKVHEVLSVSKEKRTLSWYIDVSIMSLIVVNVLVTITETVQPIYEAYQAWFDTFELVSVIIFTLEYVLRVWTADLDPRYQKPFFGRLKYMFSPMALIDLLAILPFYLPFLGVDLRHLRVLRALRIFRLFKIVRYVQAILFIKNVFQNKREELTVSLIFTLFLLLIVSTVMYYVEHLAQPEAFASIPQTMWWGIATLTTVGYGDIYPITPLGKLLGGVIAIIGIGLFALPAGILASGFSEELERRKKVPKQENTEENRCPTCGKMLFYSASDTSGQ